MDFFKDAIIAAFADNEEFGVTPEELEAALVKWTSKTLAVASAPTQISPIGRVCTAAYAHKLSVRTTHSEEEAVADVLRDLSRVGMLCKSALSNPSYQEGKLSLAEFIAAHNI